MNKSGPSIGPPLERGKQWVGWEKGHAMPKDLDPKNLCIEVAVEHPDLAAIRGSLERLIRLSEDERGAALQWVHRVTGS